MRIQCEVYLLLEHPHCTQILRLKFNSHKTISVCALREIQVLYCGHMLTQKIGGGVVILISLLLSSFELHKRERK